MAEQSITQLFRQLDPLFVQKYGPQWKRQTERATVTPPAGSSSSTALANHAALDWIEAHPTKDSAINKTRTYYSINFGIVGGAGVDESNNILAMLNAVGLAGGGTCVICADDPADPIHIAKTISIYYSNVHVVFPPGQEITYEDKGSLRIMGDYAQITRKLDGTAMKLHVDSTVVSNETVLELSATDTALMDAEANPALRIVRVGDKIVIRGQNDASGKSIEKDTSFVKALAKVGSYWQITCTDELDYTFKPTYPASEWPADLTTGTTIYVIEGSLLTVSTTVNITTATVADGTVFAVGDMVEIGDNRNEYAMNASAITGAGNPYKNPANLEQAQIIAISGNVLTFDHALCRAASTTYYGFVALMVPVVNSTISGARISYVADGIRSANALQITYAMDCHIYNCYVYGLGGRKGHGLRISYSYKCTAYRNHIVGALYTGSGEGYGITIYYATLIMVDHNYISGCRHNILLQLATLAKVIANISIDDRISGIDLHGVYSVRCSIQNNDVSRSSLNTGDSSKPGGIRIGNTSHTGGDHYNVIEGNTITGYNSTTADGIDIFAASTGNVIRNNTVIDCTVGLRFGLNSSQITPVQFIDNTLVEGNIFTRCTSRCVEIIAQPTHDGSTSNGKFSQITMINNISDGNDRHFEITGVVTTLGITDVVMVGNQVINPVNTTTTYYGISVKYTSGFVHIYDNNVSKAQRGIYLQGNGVCHVIGNKTANTVQTDPFTDGTGNTSVNYVDAMTAVSGSFTGAVTAVGSVTVTGAAASFDLYNQATNALSMRLISDVAGVLRIQNVVGAPSNKMTVDTNGKATLAAGIEGAGAFLSTGTSARFDLHNQSTNALSMRLLSDAAGVLRIQDVTGTPTNRATIDTAGKATFGAGVEGAGRFISTGAAASFDLYNQSTNAASMRLMSDFAGILRIQDITGAASNRLTLDTSANLTIGGYIHAGSDTDTTSHFGRAAIGFVPSYSDYASFAHVDNNNTTDYALLQYLDGRTYLNTKSGTVLSLRVGNADKAVVSSTGLAVTGDLSASGNATVSGTLAVTGGIATDLLINDDLIVTGDIVRGISIATHDGYASPPQMDLRTSFAGCYWTAKQSIGGTAVDLVDNGLATSGCKFLGIVHHSGGGTNLEVDNFLLPSSNFTKVIGGNTLTIAITAGGKVTAQLTGGSGTFSVSLLLVWM